MQEVYFVEFRMKLYVQLMILFVISLIGEGISSFFHLPIPGSIIGLIILFLALQFKWLRTRHVNMVGNFLLANMTILFLPTIEVKPFFQISHSISFLFRVINRRKSIHGQSLYHKMIAHAIIILLFKKAGKKDAEIFYPKLRCFH